MYLEIWKINILGGGFSLCYCPAKSLFQFWERNTLKPMKLNNIFIFSGSALISDSSHHPRHLRLHQQQYQILKQQQEIIGNIHSNIEHMQKTATTAIISNNLYQHFQIMGSYLGRTKPPPSVLL